MKKIILAVISFIIFFSINEVKAQCPTSGGGSDLPQYEDQLCAPQLINFTVTYYGLKNGNDNKVQIDWGDGSGVETVDIVLVNAPAKKWEVTTPHIYPKGLGECTYNATAYLEVNGERCSSSDILKTVLVWDTDDVLQIDKVLLTDEDLYEVCAGNEVTVDFTDRTEFNCLAPDHEYNVGRWIQWVYGTDNSNPITGVEIGGQVRSPGYSELPVYLDKSITVSGVETLPIYVPNTSVAGEYLELTLNNWNSCNPYKYPNGDLTGNLPVSKKVYVRIIDAPKANFTFNPAPAACVGNPVSFTNTSTPDLQYAWDFGNENTSTLATPPNQTYSIPGFYQVTLKVTDNTITGNTGTCFTTITKEIEILPQPIASFTINPSAAQCGGTAVNLTNTSANVPSGTTWQWEIRKSGTGGQRVTLAGANISGFASTSEDITTTLPYFGTAATAVYYVRLVANTPNQCTNTSTWKKISVKAPVGTPIFSSPLLSRCQGAGTTQYTASANYANGYNWELSPAAAGTINNSGLATWSAAFSGTATVKVTANGCGLPKSNSVNVNVTPIVGTPTAISGDVVICQGVTSGTYSTFANSATSYAWTITGTGNTISGTGTTATVSWASNFTGTATITVIASGCNSTSAPVSKDVQVKPTPQLSNPAADYLLLICSGDQAEFIPAAVLSGSSFKWTATISGPISGVTDVGDNKTIGTDRISDVLVNTGTVSGQVTYRITPFNNGCEGAPKDFTVTVSPGKPANAGAIAGTNELCEKETGINFNVPTITNVEDYIWTLPVGANISAGFNTRSITVNFTNTLPGNHTINVYGKNSCGVGAASSYNIEVKPRPVLTANAVQTVICHEEDAVITLGSNLPGTVYSWIIFNKGADISGESIASGQNITEIRQQLFNGGNAPQSITYRVTPILNGCEGAYKDIVITVNPLPDATVNADATTLCNGGQTNISMNSNVAGTTYSWTVAVSDPSLSGASNGNGNEILQTLVNSGVTAQTVTYTITPTANNCEGASKNITITVQPTPVLTTTVATNAICINEETDISLSSNVSGTTFSWIATTSNSGVGGAQNGSGYIIQQILTNSTNIPQTVTYTITPRANGCNGASKDVIITVNPEPSLDITATASQICSGDQTDIDLSSNVSGTTFSWTVTLSDPAQVSGATAGTGSSIIHTLTNISNTAQSVTYSITTEANGCPGKSKDVIITVNPTPVLTLQTTNTTLCSEEKAEIGFSSTVLGTTYSWTVLVSNPLTLTGAFAGSGTSISQTLTNTGTTQETVTYRVTPIANGCPGETKEVIITVYPPVSQANAGPDAEICGLVYSLAANTPEVGTGKWKFESGAGTAAFADDTDPATTVTVSAYGNYAFRWTITNGSCGEDADFMTLVFKDAPVTSPITGTSDVCVNAQNVVYEIIFRTGSTYTWVLEPALNAPTVKFGGGSSDNLISLDFGSNEWSGELIVTEINNNCTGEPVRFAINSYQLPVANAGNDQTVCEGSLVTLGAALAATGGSGNYTYLWSPTSGLNDATLANPTATLNFSRTYTLTVTDANTGCVSSQDAVAITVEPQLNAGTISADQTICEGTVPGVFSQTPASGGNNSYVYQWQIATAEGGPYADIAGAMSALYEETEALLETTYYRRKVSGGVCAEKITAPIEIIVEPKLQPGSIGTDQIIVAGTAPVKLTNEASALGGNGTLQYQWQQATGDGTSFTNIVGATSAEYQPGQLSITTFFRRMVSGGVCSPLVSNVATISVEPASEAGTIGQNQIICINSIPAGLNEIDPASGGTGTYEYRWLISENATDFNVIAGEMGINYAPDSPLTVTTYYKREVKSGIAGMWTGSNVVTITVELNLAPGIIAGDQTVCEGGNPAAFTVGQAPQGGSGSYQYQWKQSNDVNGPFVYINNAIAATYDVPPGLASTTYYVRQAAGGTCPAVLSNVLEVIVEPTLTGGTISDNQTVCFGGDPDAFTSTSPEGGTGTYIYQWQAKIANGTFTDITNADPATYDVAAGIEFTTTFRRKVSSGVCAEAFSNEVVVKVEPVLNPGSIAGEQTICENGDPAFINSIAAATGGAGSGSYQYQWKSSNDINGAFAAIPDALSASYNPPAGLAETTYFVREVTSGSCGPELSNIITITVQPTLLAGAVNGDVTICEGEIPAEFGNVNDATGGDGIYNYQWQWSNNQGGPYADVSGATSATFQVQNPLSATTYYVRKVTAGICSPALSNEIKVTVDPTINPGSIGGAQTICEGDIPSLFGQNPATGGDGSPQYQWQTATDALGLFQDVTGAISATYQVTDPMTATTFFRRMVSAGVCAVKYTNTIEVKVHPTTTPGSVGADQTIASNTAPLMFDEISPALGGNNSYNYQWKSSTDINGPYSNIFGANADTYQAGNLSSTTYFIREVRSGQCPAVVTEAITVTVEPNSAAGVIGASQTICEGSVPAPLTEVSPATGGTGIYNYQWQSSTDPFNDFTDIVGEIGKEFTPTEALTVTTYYRREVISGVSPAVYTTPVQITVQPTLYAGVVERDQTICENGNPNIFQEVTPASGGSGTYSYQWKSSTTQGGLYADIPLATNKLYDVPGGLTQTTYYVREVSSGVCGAILSNELTIIVDPTLIAGTVAGEQTICENSIPAAFIQTVATGGNNNYQYQWQKATSLSGPYLDINGANDENYAETQPLQTINNNITTYYYRRKVNAGVCGDKFTEPVKVTVEPSLNAGQIAGSQRICEGGNTAIFTSVSPANGGTGNYSYQWLSATALNGPFTVIANATGATYKAPDGLQESMFYAREVRSGQCQADTSNVINITVDPTLLPGAVEADQSIQVGGDPEPFLETVTVSGGGDFYSFQWQSSSTEIGSYTDIPGATSNEYDVPSGLMQTTYYRRKVESGVCGIAYTESIEVIVESTLTAGTIGADQTICEGNIPSELVEITPATGGNGIYTYQWKSSTDPNGSFTDIIGAKGKTLTFTAGLDTTTYFIREVSSGVYEPVSTETPVKITVQPQLLPGLISLSASNLEESIEICFGDDAPNFLNFESAEGGDGGYDYQWYSSSTSGSGFTLIQDADKEFYTPSDLLTETTYFIREVKSGECAAVLSNEIEVIVNPLPIVTLSSSVSSNIICSGTEVEFTAAGADLYQFYLNGIAIGAPSTSNEYITDTLVNADEVYVLGIDLKTCQSLSNIIKTTVNDLPTATISASTDICAGSQTGLVLSMTGKIPFEVIYTDGTDMFTLSNLANEYILNVGPDAITTYSLVSVKDANGCYKAIPDQQATVNVEYAVAEFSTQSPLAGCSPHTMVFLNEDIRPGVTYTWIWNDGTEENITTSADAAEITHTFNNDNNNSNSTYQVTLVATNDALGCSSSQKMSVVVYPTIELRVEKDQEAGCAPLLVNFNNNSLGVKFHRWYYRIKGTNDVLEPRDSKSTAYLLQNNTPETIVYEVVYEASADNCSAEPQVYEVVVYPELNPKFTVTPKQQNLPGSTVDIVNQTNVGDWEYLWNFGDGTTSTAPNPGSYTYGTYGEFTITLTVSNEGCVQQYKERIVIDIDPNLPFVEFSVDRFEGCGPLSVTFTNESNYVDPMSFLWNFGDGKGTSTVEHPVHTYDRPGKYSVKLEATNIFGERVFMVKEFLVEVYNQPQSIFSAGPSVIYLPDRPLRTQNLSIGATSYMWHFGDGNTSTEFEPMHYYTKEGVYDVMLVTFNEKGCSDTLLIKRAISVENPKVASSRIPNAFTPDSSGPSGGHVQVGDVSNNIFIPIADGVTEFSMDIYNRWGKLLFSSKDINIGWDGYFNGRICAADVYVYKLEMKYVNGEKVTKIGDVTLIR